MMLRWHRIREAAAQAEKDFTELDRRALSKMADKELAAWQSKYLPESAQFILADHEWSRRLTVAQVSGMRVNMLLGALIGALATLCGVYLTYRLVHVPETTQKVTPQSSIPVQTMPSQKAPPAKTPQP